MLVIFFMSLFILVVTASYYLSPRSFPEGWLSPSFNFLCFVVLSSIGGGASVDELPLDFELSLSLDELLSGTGGPCSYSCLQRFDTKSKFKIILKEEGSVGYKLTCVRIL